MYLLAKTLLHRLGANKLLRFNAVLFLGSVSVSFLNYLYYPVLSRLIRLEDFGEVQVLISLFLQFGIIFSIFSLVVVNITSNYKGSRKAELIMELERLAVAIAIGFAIIFALASPFLSNFLHFESFTSFLVLDAALLIGIPYAFRAAFLQGSQDFTSSSIGGVITAVIKLLLAVVVILAGARTFGLMVALLAAQSTGLVYLAIKARRIGFPGVGHMFPLRLPHLPAIKSEIRYVAMVSVVTLATTFLYSGDAVVVKRLFSPDQAGLYAGISNIARILFFATASVSGVLQSTVKLSNSRVQNRKILFFSLGLVGFMGGAGLLVLTFAPGLVVSILIGDRYLPLVTVLPKLALAILAISLFNLLCMYYVAIRSIVAPIIASFGAVVVTWLLWTHNGTIKEVVDSLAYGSMLVLLVLVVWTVILELKANQNEKPQAHLGYRPGL